MCSCSESDMMMYTSEVRDSPDNVKTFLGRMCGVQCRSRSLSVVYWNHHTFSRSEDWLATALDCRTIQLNEVVPNPTIPDPDLPIRPGSRFAELKLWKRKWECTQGSKPTTLQDTMAVTSCTMFPNIYHIFHLLILVSVTSANVETTNSARKSCENRNEEPHGAGWNECPHLPLCPQGNQGGLLRCHRQI